VWTLSNRWCWQWHRTPTRHHGVITSLMPDWRVLVGPVCRISQIACADSPGSTLIHPRCVIHDIPGRVTVCGQLFTCNDCT
jgi:hypothetical protein